MSLSSPPRLLAGIDIGGTNVRCALAPVDHPQEILVRKTGATPEVTEPERFVAFIAEEVRGCLRSLGRGPEALAGVGCVAPGITDVGAGMVLYAANLDWSDVPLTALLEQRLDTPVTIENDVNAAAMAEYAFGAGREARSLVYLTVSTGVAAGIVVEGRLWRGAHHAAGELGFFVPDPDHLGKDWGRNGCLELTAGGVGLARTWAERHGGNGAPGEAVEVFAQAREGNAEAVDLVHRAADYLAQAVVAVGALLDPEVLVLGGSIAQNEAWIAGRIREVVAGTLPFPMKIVHSRLGGDAPLLGALALAARNIPARTSRVAS